MAGIDPLRRPSIRCTPVLHELAVEAFLLSQVKVRVFFFPPPRQPHVRFFYSLRT